MNIVAVYFKERVRLDGNTFLDGVGVSDKQWSFRANLNTRVIQIKGLAGRFVDRMWAIPFENVRSFEYKETEPAPKKT